jgi:hypothetical protein
VARPTFEACESFIISIAAIAGNLEPGTALTCYLAFTPRHGDPDHAYKRVSIDRSQKTRTSILGAPVAAAFFCFVCYRRQGRSCNLEGAETVAKAANDGVHGTLGRNGRRQSGKSGDTYVAGPHAEFPPKRPTETRRIGET